jgi:hypothetical protein
MPPQPPQYVKIAPPSLGEQAGKAVLSVVLGGIVLVIVVVLLAAVTGR